MNGFVSSKRWELLLAAAMPVLIPVLDALSSGAFHGKTLGEAVLAGALIAARALASHQQSPPVPAATDKTADGA